MSRHPAAALALLATLLGGGAVARADEPDAATMLTAVQLAEEGGELFQAGKFAEALERYQRADAIVRRQTIGLRIARCLARMGRLTEAVERYDQVARMPLPPGLEPDKLAKQVQAQAQAESERDALLRRVAGVVVELAGPSHAVVTIDGKVLSSALYGVKRAIDPGPHHLEARAGSEIVTRDVVLQEGEVLQVPLQLHVAAEAPPVVVAPPPVPPPPVPPSPVLPSPAPPRDPAGPRRIAGFVGIGAGGLGLAIGAIAAGMAFSRKNDLQQPSKCGPTILCPARFATEAGEYNTARNASSAGFIAGAIVGAAGVVLVATAPSAGEPRSASFFVGPTGAGVRGAF